MGYTSDSSHPPARSSDTSDADLSGRLSAYTSNAEIIVPKLKESMCTGFRE
jgi:hypothetical protein